MKGHVLQAGYVLTKNLSLLSTAWITKPVDDVPGLNYEHRRTLAGRHDREVLRLFVDR